MTRGPFRGDQVGSLLRPAELHQAREHRKAGEISAEELRAVEDRCIRDVVALQEAAGLQGITDGEFRRAFWHVDFLTGFDGIDATGGQYAVTFKGEHGEVAGISTMLGVTGKVRRSRPIVLDHFKVLKSVTRRTPKVCIPAATYLHMRGGRKVVDQAAYPDLEEFWADIAAAYQAEIADLAAAGCTYLQIDDVSFAMLCDAKIREQVRRDGEDPDALPGLYARIINSLVAKRPDGMTVTVHTCRGNHKSMWMAEGGYDPIAEAVFAGLDVDGVFLEYDTERAGGFEPLRYAPKGRRIVLGLVSTKQPQLESKDALKRRIEEASKFVDIDDLCLSPQCGFASTEAGNELTEDDERRKLELIVEVATEVWGGLG
jgi:5-methyltetrahydropteroyltriglutamate--homocysteine methyltransferase